MDARDVVPTIDRKIHPATLWLILNLGIAALYAGLAMQEAFSIPGMIQDDARVYLIGMQRFLDPELFANDIMAKYFQSVTPWGLSTLFWFASRIGISPIVFSKLLPAFLSMLLGWYGYRLTIALFPIPSAAFLSSLILLQSYWFRDDFTAAAPRSFWGVLLVAFLYYFVKRSWIAIALFVSVMGLFCPLAALLIGLWLGLRSLLSFRFSISRRPEWVIFALTIAMLVPYAFSQSEFAPTVTAAEARTMPEFLLGGRLPFFYPNLIQHFIDGTDSGVQISLNPPFIALGLLLPVLVYYRHRIPLLEKLNPNWTVLPQLAGTGIIAFVLAHVLFVKLHFPSRYTTHSWRVAMAIAAGIVMAIAVEQSKAWCGPKLRSILLIALTSVLILYPHVVWKHFPATRYGAGANPALYEFLKTTPKSSLTAYLGVDASYLPLASNRSTLTATEYAVPFHLGYYRPIRQRTIEFIEAQYSPTLEPAKRLIQNYQIGYWLIDHDAFTPNYVRNYKWLRLFEPARGRAIAILESGQMPALQKIMSNCTIATTGTVTILNPQCILSQNLGATPTPQPAK
jgi:hypothetical protein